MMLRNVILATFALLFLGAAAAAAAGAMPWGPAIMLGIVAAIITFERQRYRAQTIVQPKAMAPTAERFVDPETGRKVQVWANAAGERAYVEEGEAIIKP